MIVPRENHTLIINEEPHNISLPSEQTLDAACDNLHDICHKAGLGVGLVQLNNLVADAKFMRQTILKIKQQLEEKS